MERESNVVKGSSELRLLGVLSSAKYRGCDRVLCLTGMLVFRRWKRDKERVDSLWSDADAGSHRTAIIRQRQDRFLVRHRRIEGFKRD